LADRHETLPHHRNLALLYNPSPKIQGAFPQKILGAKNMQNFGRFFATSDFDCEYLRNCLRYPNRNSKFFYIDSSRVLENKSRELWSTNFPDLDVSLDPLNCTFWAAPALGMFEVFGRTGPQNLGEVFSAGIRLRIDRNIK